MHTGLCIFAEISRQNGTPGLEIRKSVARISHILHKTEDRMPKAKVLKFDAAGPGLTRSEILKVCDAENVRFMRLQFTDILGVIKNVEIPRSQFSKALDGEIQFDGSSIEGFTRI